VACGAHSSNAPAHVEATLGGLKCMAYGGIVVCMDNTYLRAYKAEGPCESEATETTGKRADVNDGRQATQWLWGRRGTFPLASCLVCPGGPLALSSSSSLSSSSTLFFLSFALFSLLFFGRAELPRFILSLSPPSGTVPSCEQAPSNPLHFVSRWPPSITTVLCCLAPPSTLTKPLSQHRHPG
jgi:hypothetical protein